MSQHILITGASSGIGAALAEYYAQQNASLLLIARHRERLEKVAQTCRTLGSNVTTYACDVTDQHKLNEWIIQQDDKKPITLLIANAGQSCNQEKLHQTNPLQIESSLVHTHLLGMLNTIWPIKKRMEKRGHGHIALMSSINAFIPIKSSTIYGAVKAAILHYGLSLNKQYKNEKNIHVSIICPGFIKTPLTDLNTHPMPFRWSSTKAASYIGKQLQKKKTVIAFPWLYVLTIKLYRYFHILG